MGMLTILTLTYVYFLIRLMLYINRRQTMGGETEQVTLVEPSGGICHLMKYAVGYVYYGNNNQPVFSTVQLQNYKFGVSLKQGLKTGTILLDSKEEAQALLDLCQEKQEKVPTSTFYKIMQARKPQMGKKYTPRISFTINSTLCRDVKKAYEYTGAICGESTYYAAIRNKLVIMEMPTTLTFG